MCCLKTHSYSQHPAESRRYTLTLAFQRIFAGLREQTLQISESLRGDVSILKKFILNSLMCIMNVMVALRPLVIIVANTDANCQNMTLECS